MYEIISQTIQHHDLLSPEAFVVLGVSGGADSLCLLDGLSRLGYQIVVAHLDHQLRPESSAEVEFVRGMCDHYAVPFETESVNVGQRAEAGGSLEEVARLARYNFLARVAEDHGAHSVAVGHTADDQVETVVMHLLRGSGAAGLRGMLPKTRFTEWLGIESREEIDLIRPLLDLSRADTVMHCKTQGLQPLEDPSNTDPIFYRNRIRHELLPLLESYNSGIHRVILHLSEVMREQVTFNRTQLESVWPLVFSEAGSSAYLIEVDAFRKLQPFLQRTIVRRGIALLAPTLRDISFEATGRAVEWLQTLIETESLALPGGLSLEKCGEKALLRKVGEPIELTAYPQMIAQAELRLKYPGEVSLQGGWRITAHLAPNNAEGRAHWYADSDHQIAVLDAKALSSELRVRVRKAGDRIQLPNVDGRTKIADLMTNRKIPRQMRTLWPLVLVEDSVIWVPGIQQSNQALLEQGSTHVVVLKLHPPDEVSHVETTL